MVDRPHGTRSSRGSQENMLKTKPEKEKQKRTQHDTHKERTTTQSANNVKMTNSW